MKAALCRRDGVDGARAREELRAVVEPLGWRVQEPREKRGRPLAPNAPDPSTVRDMKARRLSWGQIARKLGCTPSAARRAFKRPAAPLSE